MQIAQRMQAIRVSGTIRLANMARERAAAGLPIIDLAEGEPDFDTPSHVIEAAHRAALDGQTRYTAVAGIAELREAVAEKFRTENRFDCAARQTIVGTGAKQLIFNALLASLNPEDEAIIPAPYWVSYPDIVKIAGGVPVTVQCDSPAFKLSPQALHKALTPRTRWLILNSPCNPTGAVYSEVELAALSDVLRTRPEVGVMCDDIYEKILYGSAVFATLGQVAPDLADRILTINGVSKSHAMTGWRIGFATGPQDLIDAMIKLQGQSTTNASSVAQAAALAALTGPQEHVSDWCRAYSRRRSLVLSALESCPGLTASAPDGAFYVFANCAGALGKAAPSGSVIETDIELSEFLLETAGVAIVPGTEFGYPGHQRLCFAKSDENLTCALEAIREALCSLT
ncbi:pyridoxal phosphate-dependent aminotransferase [Pelagibius sp. Alg239-R121]|uniref:pyridoxal phosphate-dependent aminotransferase n=1 Tax=Pelagibius sp. Alg239-R121 TaxID=2993448 RepID=UPI0024A6308A|nr:pyridoxal phosphate-dependent aminotransferase [Pelagibius sp. Alg239-R121]